VLEQQPGADGRPRFIRKTIIQRTGAIHTPVVDLNGDGRLDIAVAGKSGTYILFNEGR